MSAAENDARPTNGSISRALLVLILGILAIHFVTMDWMREDASKNMNTLVDDVIISLLVSGLSMVIVWRGLRPSASRRYVFVASLVVASLVFLWDQAIYQTVTSALGLDTRLALLVDAFAVCATAGPTVAWALWMGSHLDLQVDRSNDVDLGTSQPHVLVLASALALLAFFVAAGAMATSFWIHQRVSLQGYVEVIDVSGRQRMLSQQVARYVALLGDRSADHRRRLEASVAQMETEAQRLDHLAFGLGLQEDASPLLSAMTALQDDLRRRADRLLPTGDSDDRQREIDAAGIQELSDRLTGLAEQLVALLGQAANARAGEITRRVTSFGIKLMLMLVIGTLIILLPVALVARVQHGRVKSYADVAMQSRAATEATLKRLVAYQTALSEKAIISVTNAEGVIEEVNDLFCTISKYSREELIGQHHRIVNSGHHSSDFFRRMWRTIGGGGIWTGDICNRAKDGSLYWVDTTIVPIFDAGRRITQYLSIRYDITERRREQAALAESESHLRRAQAVAKIGSWQLNTAENVLRWSDETYRIFGLPVGMPLTYEVFLDRVHPDDRCMVDRAWKDALQGKPYSIEHRIVVEGITKFVHERADIEFDAVGRPLHAVGTVQDITERKSIEANLHWQAEHDMLTGLPNRRVFQKRLESALSKASANQRDGAVMMIDLDHFKNVNDSVGHQAGDVILSEVAKRLQRSVRKRDMIARFGGDEFLVLLEEIRSKDDPIRIGRKIRKRLAEPYHVGERVFHLDSSVGISTFPEDGRSADELIRAADTAMYCAKRSGRRMVYVYNELMSQKTQEAVAMAEELRTAITEGQFVLHYQPVVNLVTNAVDKCEALVRWRHPTAGLLGPGLFIPVAEAYGLISDIEEKVVHEARRQRQRWRQAGIDVEVAVNISAEHLKSDRRLKRLLSLIRGRSEDNSGLAIEITESHLMSDEQGQFDRLAQIVDAGIPVAIDDFGTGYSSFHYLTRLPVRYLKIDRSFVSTLDSAAQRRVVRAMIGIAHDLGMQVIAEGVETCEQLEFLKGCGCDHAQGYHFSHPLDDKAFVEFIDRWRSDDTHAVASRRWRKSPRMVPTGT